MKKVKQTPGAFGKNNGEIYIAYDPIRDNSINTVTKFFMKHGPKNSEFHIVKERARKALSAALQKEVNIHFNDKNAEFWDKKTMGPDPEIMDIEKVGNPDPKDVRWISFVELDAAMQGLVYLESLEKENLNPDRTFDFVRVKN